MTHREFRGWLVLIVTLVALTSSGIILWNEPESWKGILLLVIGFVGTELMARRLRFARRATREEKLAVENKEKEIRENIAMWIMVIFVITVFLEIVAVGVGLVLNYTIGGELGTTIIHYAVIIGGIVSLLFFGALFLNA